MFTIVIDDSRMRQRLGELHDALIGAGKTGDARVMMENEARLFLKGVVNLTPPPGYGSAAKAQGEAAVTRDLKKLFTPVNEEMLNTVGSQFGVSGIDEWITSKTSSKPTHLKWDRIDPLGSGMADFHHRNQDSRGRARKLKRKGDAWYAPYVVTQSDFARYLALIISHVGRRKAAWAVSYRAIGGTVQRWIERHISGARGDVLNDLANQNKPSITMASHAAGVGQDEHVITSQMRIRREAIGRKMKRLIAGYATDMKYGRKIQPQEARGTG